MCQHCDYSNFLEASGLGHTPKRHRVLEVIGNNSSPLSAQQIFDTLSRTDNINRVTVYRILDLLVDKGWLTGLTAAVVLSYTAWQPMKTIRPIPTFTASAAAIWNA